MQSQNTSRHGLILLVVLGMLALFSLLTVTYLSFSGQAKIASLQLAKREFRGTPPSRILDSAVRQIVRGTNDRDSVLWRHGLLEDLWGSDYVELTARVSRADGRNGQYTLPPTPIPTNNSGFEYGPKLYTPYNGISYGPFLKIPLEYSAGLPRHHDAWTGRVLTFINGPLANQSFPIMRYIGELDLTEINIKGPVQYSVLIDLTSADLSALPAYYSPSLGRSMTIKEFFDYDMGLASYANQNQGDFLLYEQFAGATLGMPFRFIVNGGSQNNDGVGLARTGSTVTPMLGSLYMNQQHANHNLTDQLQAPFNQLPEAFQPNHSKIGSTNAYFNQSYNINGDMDEPYDAADYNNFFLALRRYIDTQNNLETSDEITPSFHRPELINYIAGLHSGQMQLTAFQSQPEVFLSFLELVERVTARPLSYRIENFPDGNGGRFLLEKNPQFTGSVIPQLINGQPRDSRLKLDWNALNQDSFDAWLRWQTRGPWDVDTDADGVRDSVWVDLNFPIATSAEGKLLKIMAAIYIEDLDGKLDINAAGAQIQGNSTNYPVTLSSEKYAFNANYPQPGDWPQGLGLGPADIYLRHLFPANRDQDMLGLMRLRYSDLPGIDGQDDVLSQVIANRSDPSNQVLRPSRPNNLRLPGLPMSMHGRIGIAFDLLGNPILTNSSNPLNILEEEIDDPYESRPLLNGYGDHRVSISAWERLVRAFDPDRSAMPRDLENATGDSWNAVTNGNVVNTAFLGRVRSISPRNVELTTPRFPFTYTNGASQQARVGSFVEFLESYWQTRLLAEGQTVTYPVVSNASLSDVFPLEFATNRRLDLNRPFGNGIDGLPNGIGANGDVDEPAELNANPEAVMYLQRPNVNADLLLGRTKFDPAWEGDADYSTYFAGAKSRQLFARHLYCMAQMLLPAEYEFPNQPEEYKNKPANERSALRARTLAQWAANVVDYRDADSAMTRFVYDPNPFYDNAGLFKPEWNPQANCVVFGMEQPELLITESLATHDARYFRNPTASPPRYEQVRVPEGSLFLEFFCPRSTASTQNSDDTLPGTSPSLYSQNANGRLALDLSKFTQDNSGNRYPVWRVLFLKPEVVTDPMTGPRHDTNNFTEAFTQATPVKTDEIKGKRRFNYSYQIGNPDDGLDWRVALSNEDNTNQPQIPELDEPEIDRVLWFTSAAAVPPTNANVGAQLPNVSNPENRVYFYQEGETLLEGGQYLVVGPRPTTYFGSREQTLPRASNMPSKHRISIRHGNGPYFYDWFQIWDQDGIPGMWLPSHRVPSNMPNMPYPPAMANMVRPCITMIAGANLPADWSAANDPVGKLKPYVGLNISEPNTDRYYPVPTTVSIPGDNTGDPTIGAPGFEDLPEDGYLPLDNATLGGSRNVFDGENGAGSRFFLEEHAWEVDAQNVPKAKTQENWSAAVLQRLADPALPYHRALNPYITVDWISIDLTVFSGEDAAASNGQYMFASRAKSGKHSFFENNAVRESTEAETFFSYDVDRILPSSEVATSDAYFKHELKSEHQADEMTPVVPDQSRGAADAKFQSFGYLNKSFRLRGYQDGLYTHAYYTGAPSRTPDALLWPNRGFVTPLELANVPLSAPGTFQQDFFFETTAGQPRHRHTLNFDANVAAAASQLVDLFQFVETPSPWSDSWKVLDPNTTVPTGNLAQDELFRPFHAPFNLVPTHRYPGKINLNTLTLPNVFKGLMGNMMAVNDRQNDLATIPYWSEFQDSRTKGSYDTNKPTHNGAMFTEKSVLDGRGGEANPYLFKALPVPFAGTFTAPSALSSSTVQFPGIVESFSPRTHDHTLLRPRRVGTVVDRLFTDEKPGLSIYPGTRLNNSHIYNYPASRLANMVTDKSNVFAIRITLGYFEYDLNNGLGIEYGSDQNQAARHRGFYLIDRSIPVGVIPGSDLNTENCILHRRIID